MEIISTLSKLFENYRGHDQFLALIGYNCTMLSGLYPQNSKNQIKFKTIASQIVNCRAILRFLDDFSMLQYTLTYGLGKHEKNIIIRIATIIGNISSQLYYPLEHIAWLADYKIINIKSDKFWFIGTIAWLVSSLTAIISNSLVLHQTSKLKDKQEDDEQKIEKTKRKVKLTKNQVKIILLLIKEFNYVILAIYWLPPGFLWSGKLSTFKAGLAGSIAIACNLIRMII